jgi:hypothetical protein
MPPQHSVNGIIPPWKKLPLQGPLRAGPQGYGALSISGDSWEAKPTSFIHCCMKITPLLKLRLTNADGSNIPHITWNGRPGHQVAGQLERFEGCPLLYVLYARGLFMLQSRCLRNGGISTKDNLTRDGMFTGNNCWSARKNWAGFHEDAEMVDWPEVIPQWDSFSEEGKKYLSRQMEVNAAFLEHVDYHIGRVIDHIEEMGELDNTLVIYLTADNGCTAEGTPTGTFSELLMQNGFPPLTMEQQLEKLEEFGGLEAWGGPHMANHYSVAWAYASSTPFQWTKQMASHFGGTMSATAIRYPKAIKAKGEWRRQFQNVTDLVPTILEVTGVPAPDYVNGQKRKPYPGKSLTYAWNNPDAKTNHPTQYFEMLGFVGLYHDGWTIAGKPYRIPWSVDPSSMANFDPLNTEWELYNIEEDPIQQVNVADQYPEKVKELEKYSGKRLKI